MSTHKHVDLLCIILILAILASVVSLFAMSGGIQSQEGMEKEYESGLFDTSVVHTLDITIDDWKEICQGGFLHIQTK